MPRAFTSEERDVLRRKLLDAARQSLEEVGIRRTSVDELVRQVGVSKGAFYLLFASKEELVTAVFEEVEGEVRAELDELVGREEGTAQQRTTEFVRFLFRILERHPLLTMLADPVEAPLLWRAVPEEEMQERMLDDDRYFTEVAQRLHRQGALDSRIDPATVAALPRLTLAVVQGRGLIGDHGYQPAVDLMVEALGRELARGEE